MYKHYRWLIFTLLCLLFSPVFAWNAYGHFLVAQIAYDNLDTKTRLLIEQDNRALNQHGHDGIVKTSAWLDTLRKKTGKYRLSVLNQLHYIDLPYYSEQKHPLSAKKMNVIMAIQLARWMLESPQTILIDRAFAVRMLWHVVADIHQPMHCISRFSSQHPKGDFGGTRYALGNSSYGKNLHAYWDMGGGLLTGYTQGASKCASLNVALAKKSGDQNAPFDGNWVCKHNEIKQVAKILETRWPCQNDMSLNPKAWAKESYDLAMNVAYQIPEKEIPDIRYQEIVAENSAKRIALAGCRLAAISKEIYAQYQAQSA